MNAEKNVSFKNKATHVIFPVIRLKIASFAINNHA